MSNKKVDFILPADTAAEAISGILLGDFNNWDTKKGINLKQQKDGSWKASVALEPGSYEYRYLLSDGRWVNDSKATKYRYDAAFSVENCIIEVAPNITKTEKKQKSSE